MSSLGTDLGSALEVNPNPGADPKEAASASNDREPAGDTAEEDRKALNVAKEAQKRVEKLQEQIAQLSSTVLGAIGQQNGSPSAAPAKPAGEPYDREAINTAVASGDLQSVVEMMEANFQHRLDRTSDTTLERVDRAQQARDARAFLVKELGLADPNREENQEILRLATQLQRDYPEVVGKDPAMAQLMASGIVYRKIARAELDFPDFREETLRRTKEPEGQTAVGPTETEEQAIKPDWNAKNRGLPDDVVRQLTSWGLGDMLVKSNDPHMEQVARETIVGLVNDGSHGG